MNEHLTDEQLDKVLAKMRSVAQAAMGHPGLEVSETSWGWVVMGTSAAQLAHIEAFQPSTVLELLADIGRFQSERDELRETVARLTRERDEWEANEQKVAGERDELQRRLDAVLKLHVWHNCPDPGCNFAIACNACDHPFPCPTVKAARGEQ